MRGVILAVALTGCISVPPFHGDGDAGNGDGTNNPGPLAARLIANAYREGGEDGMASGSYMMSKAGYAIPTAGIVDDDLIIFVGNIDNGAQGFFKLPTGFTEIAQHYYGQDGQTYVLGYKIAANEPTLLTGMYQSGVSSSAAATLSLIAVTGYDPQNPIEFALKTDHDPATDPADISSPGITTTAANSLLLYAAGADWTPNDGKNTFDPPAGFTTLTSVGDRDTHWDWTCQGIAYKLQPDAGPTGPIMDTLTGLNYSNGTTHIPGGGWNVLVAIAPRS